MVLNNYSSSSVDRHSFICPIGILWLKKPPSKREGYSITKISANGNGGMLLHQISKVTKENEHLKISMSKKQDSFAGSSIVRIYRGDRSGGFVTLRCTKADAEDITVGCNALIDTLKNENKMEQVYQNLPNHFAKT